MRAAAAGIDFFIVSKTGVCRSISAAEVFLHRFFLFKRAACTSRKKGKGGARHGNIQNSRLNETFLSLDFLCYCDPASFRAPSLRSIFILL